jgi:hypothetical protein
MIAGLVGKRRYVGVSCSSRSRSLQLSHHLMAPSILCSLSQAKKRTRGRKAGSSFRWASCRSRWTDGLMVTKATLNCGSTASVRAVAAVAQGAKCSRRFSTLVSHRPGSFVVLEYPFLCEGLFNWFSYRFVSYISYFSATLLLLLFFLRCKLSAKFAVLPDSDSVPEEHERDDTKEYRDEAKQTAGPSYA